MKTINLKKIVVVLLLTLAFVNSSKAQTCTYNVINNYNCSIVVNISYYDPACNATTCDVITSFTIAAATTQPFTCGAGCSGGLVCDVRVTLTDVGGTPVGPLFVDSSVTFNTTGIVSTCVPSGNVRLFWSGSSTLIQ